MSREPIFVPAGSARLFLSLVGDTAIAHGRGDGGAIVGHGVTITRLASARETGAHTALRRTTLLPGKEIAANT